MIKNIKPRLYQESIFYSTVKKNCLVVLPTGTGKTLVSLLLAAYRLENYPTSKILILAPTKPLVEQHFTSFKKHILIPENQIVMLTGHIKPEKRREEWNKARIIISTPQGLENDIITNKTPLENVSLIVFDEAHRAVKDYSYVFIANQYNKKANHPKILALTASPGSDKSQIEEVINNLYIEHIEIRTDEDEDIKEHIQETKTKWVEVEFPEKFKELRKHLDDCYLKKLRIVKEMGQLEGQPSNYTKTAILSLQAEIRGRISSGEKDFEILKSISLLAEAMKIQHATELLESQGLNALQQYFQKIELQAKTSSTKAVKNLVADPLFLKSKQLLNHLLIQGKEHPKIIKLKEILTEETVNKKTKIIIFTQYRITAQHIKKVCDELKINSKTFIGQANKEEKGLSQKEQKKIIDEFTNKRFNCLISTSIGEEGLDIPQVDLVLFYEPIPSAIRTIQRRGRTGRLEKGRVLILVTKGTRDESYRWASHHKEKRMYKIIKDMKKKHFGEINSQNEDKELNEFIRKEVKEQDQENKQESEQERAHIKKINNSKNEKSKKNQELTDSTKTNKTNSEKIKIVVDHREKGSKIVKYLLDLKTDIDLKTLTTGDYILSNEAVVEYKTKKDFVDSIIDGRLLSQVKNLNQYSKPIIIVEGEEDIFAQRNIHPNAIRGMVATITVSYRTPIIYTKNQKDTALTMYIIAKREQEEKKKEFQMHTLKPITLKEQQEYIVSSLPGVGSKLARPLLKKFKTIKKLINAKKESLQKIDLIGEKKAERIKEVIEKKYEES